LIQRHQEIAEVVHKKEIDRIALEGRDVVACCGHAESIMPKASCGIQDGELLFLLAQCLE